MKFLMKLKKMPVKIDMKLIHLDTTIEKDSHWVCLYKNKYYLDPYGI